MVSQQWIKAFSAAALGLATMATGARAQSTASVLDRDLPSPMEALETMQDAGKIIFKVVDENNDGQISQAEAIDAGNLIVGGFFFRADTNGDGVVSAQEAQAARDTFLAQKPILKFVIARAETVKPANGSSVNPGQVFMTLVDTNQDRQIQASEVRTAVQTVVQGIFATADTNRDGQMSPTEVNAAIVGVVKAAEQATFQAADLNNDGKISKEEFAKSLTDPASAVFAVLDANNDGQLSPQELQSAGRIVEGQLKRAMVVEPANSAANLIRSGLKPDQVAPVPNIATPRPGQTSAPAPGSVPPSNEVPRN
jgi:Ca2+-binding EF-hand superfamily protein